MTIHILEHACRLHASSSWLTRDGALKRAYVQYMSSNTHNALTNQFQVPSPQWEYDIPQLTEFVLQHRL